MASTSKRPVVYLHVGEPKSGTTFVQQVMWSNRDELARQGVLLPGAHAQDHFRANQDLREVPQAADDPTGSHVGEWNLLVKQALHADRAAVISHELLAAATEEQAARGLASLADAEVHVVVSLRDFESLLPAEWQETVKHRNQQTWETWLARVMKHDVGGKPGQARWFWRVHDTPEVLRRWTQGVPAEHVHVVTMPRPGAPPDLLWKRFASVLGVDPAPFDLSAARANTSLGLAEVEMLRRLNVALGRDGVGTFFYAVNVKERLAHDYLAKRPASLKPLMSEEARAWAHARCAQVVASLRGSGFQIVGDLGELLPRPAAAPASRGGATKAAATGDVPAEDVLDAAIGALATVLHNQYEPPPPAPQESRLVDVGTGRFAPSRKTTKRLRELSNRYPAVARLRVWVWRMTERSRGRRKSR
jgi:hypothetical protein